MTNPPSQIGPYTIDREIGRGGMGVVYLGHDTRLGRNVAIKALPQELAADPARLERFEREARVLAQLNHPNIAGIHGVEEHDGARYLVLEHVQGETLADRIDRGPLPIDEAIEIAVQIAAGIEAAHEAGVIHRDLKPGNVMVTPDGRAKVLDFGLARTEEGQSSTSQSEAATLTSPAIAHSPTIPGVILGTAAYMSPEQARGRRVDKRTDIWSFGVLLYEMCTGVGPFIGETVTDSIGAILHKNIDLDQLPPTTPQRVRRVITRCLQRDKQKRLRDIGDAIVELQSASIDTPIVAAPAPGGVRSTLRTLLLVALLPIIAAAAWFASRMTIERPTPRVIRFDAVVETPESRLDDARPMISPDGSAIAFTRNKQLFVRSLDSFDSRVIPGTQNASDPIWSPDGKWLAYGVDGTLYKISLSGGGQIKLSPNAAVGAGELGGGWTDDDRIIFAAGVISQISARGGEVSTLLETDLTKVIDYHDPAVVPGTDVVIFIRHNRNNTLELCASDGDRVVTIVPASEIVLDSPCYAPSGHVLYTRGFKQTDVWAIEFDPITMTASGDPFLVEPNASEPSVSRNGTLCIQRGQAAMGSSLSWLTREGVKTPINADFDVIFALSISPDLKHIAFTAGTPPKLDIWVHDVDRGINRRVTFLETMVASTGWSPDSRELAVVQFMGAQDGNSVTQFCFADGSGQSRDQIDGVMFSMDAQWENAVWFKGNSPSIDTLYARPFDDPESRTELPMPGRDFGAFISPGADYLAYSAADSGVFQVYCTSYPNGSGKWQISTQGGRSPVWSTDGDSIYYFAEKPVVGIYEVEVVREPSFEFGAPVLAFDLTDSTDPNTMDWVISQDGQSLLYVVQPEQATGTLGTISVIENWFEAFRDR
ncbi:MAG: serine/threonine-protein kinase [Phycisphaeraceae bacterium]|nr:serine/threonine-protein kinase [Phycisphaeraceae bacterium]MCB9847168.1 serine/threonine-protein kinase [Phycisphaeraceae bacterium]